VQIIQSCIFDGNVRTPLLLNDAVLDESQEFRVFAGLGLGAALTFVGNMV
jgi:hypothetical protein